MENIEKTKVNFRALREMLDIPRQSIADELGVSYRLIQNWEEPSLKYAKPSKKGWVLLFKKFNLLHKKIDYSYKKVKNIEKVNNENKPNIIMLPLYTSQKEYDNYHHDGGNFSEINRATFFVAKKMLDNNKFVNFSFADEYYKNFPNLKR
jgi:DNA-binding XRE family transcriptional regulator